MITALAAKRPPSRAASNAIPVMIMGGPFPLPQGSDGPGQDLPEFMVGIHGETRRDTVCK